MKLIDMLVKETIENGWSWPDGYNSIAQDKDHFDLEGDIYAYIHASNAVNYWFEDNDSGYGLLLFNGYEVAEDARISLVTREQYESALASKKEVWIEWGGGLIPISTNTFVDVKFNNGDVRLGKIAGEYSWEHVWEDSNIIAYRLHQPQEAEQDKADLNECIGKDAAPVWNGEGLPPVGCFCEITDSDGMLVYGQGESGEVIAHVENTAVIRMSYGLGCFEAVFLRPLRTEAELNRDAAVEQMMKFATIHTTKSLGLDLALRSCYDAIAAGKIPGVKLED